MNTNARQLLDEFVSSRVSIWGGDKAFMAAAPVRAITEASAETQGLVAVIALEAVLDLTARDSAARENRLGKSLDMSPLAEIGVATFTEASDRIFSLRELVRKLLMRKAALPAAQLAHMLNLCGKFRQIDNSRESFIEKLVGRVEATVRSGQSCAELDAAIHSLVSNDSFCENFKAQALKERFRVLTEAAPKLPIVAGEAWADAAIAMLGAASPAAASAWSDLLTHCRKCQGTTPSQRWNAKAKDLLKAIGEDAFRMTVAHWFQLVDKPRTQPGTGHEREWQAILDQLIIEPHADILKGLAWCCVLQQDRDLARVLTVLALASYRKLPGIGPRLAKVGNACVMALGTLPGTESVGQLALLKLKVKFGPARKVIEKVLEATAQRIGLPCEDLEEMAVPAYGLTGVGVCEEPLGEFTARLTVAGDGSTELVWLKPDTKPQKSVPASVKAAHTEELKELQAAAKDIQRMLPAQRERLDGLFLAQKSWPLAVWRERYLDHPLVGVLARRLIWEFTTDGKATAGMLVGGRSRREGAHAESRKSERGSAKESQSLVTSAPTEGELVDLDLRPVALDDSTVVRLWHPIGKDVDEVLAWRGWLESQQIQQPFKQAHREVYVLTDAERRTGTYSNRFAAHILRQHQFNALCAARGWKNKLRLMVDAEFPPASRLLPQWGLRAEFWIEGIGDNYGTDTAESGAFLRVATDQVRFCRIPLSPSLSPARSGGEGGRRPGEEELVPLDQIPPPVFSEIMRDVDLFVGVASVGNDPTWNDGGPEGRFRDYWQSYSFGDLSATAQTRKAILERLVPRLKIADRCSFADKFLVVRGQLRSYKIHLGSGNILMTPNDQYLCIVPKQSAAAGDGNVFLPFEGDGLLSVILSKAFLLAADDRITDATIVSQLKR